MISKWLREKLFNTDNTPLPTGRNGPPPGPPPRLYRNGRRMESAPPPYKPARQDGRIAASLNKMIGRASSHAIKKEWGVNGVKHGGSIEALIPVKDFSRICYATCDINGQRFVLLDGAVWVIVSTQGCRGDAKVLLQLIVGPSFFEQKPRFKVRQIC